MINPFNQKPAKAKKVFSAFNIDASNNVCCTLNYYKHERKYATCLFFNSKREKHVFTSKYAALENIKKHIKDYNK